MITIWTGLLIVFLLVIIIGVVYILNIYFKDYLAAQKRIKDLGSQVIDINGSQMEYLRQGNGEPVLVIHGAMGGFDQGLWLAKSFDLSSYRIIPISRFGYLRSAIPDGATLNTQADAFADFLDAMEIDQVVVLAISSGTTSAIRFAARHPQRVSKMILISPDSPGGTQIPIPPLFIFDLIMRSDFVYWALIFLLGAKWRKAIGLVPKNFKLTPQFEEMVKKVQKGDLPISPRIDGMIFETYECDAEFKASVTSTSPFPLTAINTPILVINALDDPISRAENVEFLASQFQNGHRLILPDGGHFLFGHIEQVRKEINQFLNGI